MVESTPILPFKNFRFVVYFGTNTKPVAAVSKVSMLKRTTEVVSHRNGGDVSTPRHAPGSTKFEPITLERGVTLDTAFESWANQVYSTDTKGTVRSPLANYKQDITIEVRNVSGIAVVKYVVTRAWVSEYVALPDLDANANAVMLEHVVVQNEGWERDSTFKPEAGVDDL
jgi:phage tail-like protein